MMMAELNSVVNKAPCNVVEKAFDELKVYQILKWMCMYGCFAAEKEANL